MANKNLIDLDAMSKKQLDMLIKKAKKIMKILPITDTPATAKFLLRFSMSRAQELKCLFRLQCSNSAAEQSVLTIRSILPLPKVKVLKIP